MSRKNRKCLSCGTAFSFCPNCSGADRLAPAWRAEFCCETCKEIWVTATKYNVANLSKADAKAAISALDLKPIEQYVSCIQRDLNTILSEDSKPKRGKKVLSLATEKVVAEAVSDTDSTETKLPDCVATPMTTEEISVATDVAPVEKPHEVSHEVVNKIEEE